MVRKDYREATLVLQAARDQNPRNPVYLNKLGIALHQQDSSLHGPQVLRARLESGPVLRDAQNNIGTIWYQRKRYGKAIRRTEGHWHPQ